ncbi:periplasmic heavy metal sensor [Saccharibacter sp. 17.LH.SD]|uniref:Spy/CpxP family protein refolding chaperone n=1 Tax=Saccharibacter sp. 17.LH.SD TaxID=2689393 RepID=UPI001367B732|nr:Spy/CpxP family protein refolding chaperone [Saccharibacter sp. 17.LH.SD]MXV45090.1 periplasmic heavy metal sensor [Saccharibacter sp. 17.LH.SD]
MKHFMHAIVLGTASLAATVSLAHAQPVPAPAAPHHMYFHHPLMIDLPGVSLSDEQKAKIHAILEANRPDPSQMDPQNDPHHQLKALLQAPGPVDRGKITKLEKKISQEDAEHLRKMIDVTLAIRGILTPQQLQQGLDNSTKLEDLHRQAAAIIRQASGPEVPTPPPGL